MPRTTRAKRLAYVPLIHSLEVLASPFGFVLACVWGRRGGSVRTLPPARPQVGHLFSRSARSGRTIRQGRRRRADHSDADAAHDPFWRVDPVHPTTIGGSWTPTRATACSDAFASMHTRPRFSDRHRGMCLASLPTSLEQRAPSRTKRACSSPLAGGTPAQKPPFGADALSWPTSGYLITESVSVSAARDLRERWVVHDMARAEVLVDMAVAGAGCTPTTSGRPGAGALRIRLDRSRRAASR
jgi:hypothetical protein